MSRQLKVQRPFHVRRGRRSRRELRRGEPDQPPAPGRVPRVSRLMALAIRFDELIREGIVADQAELARLGHVSRARLTQIMNLLNLAPDIQEEVLLLLPTERGRDPISERHLRPIAAVADWRRQRQMWRVLSRTVTADATAASSTFAPTTASTP